MGHTRGIFFKEILDNFLLDIFGSIFLLDTFGTIFF